jgi:hypothetical protein
MKTRSNYAKPTMPESRDGGVVGVRVFGNALIYPRLNAFVSRDDITAEN